MLHYGPHTRAEYLGSNAAKATKVEVGGEEVVYKSFDDFRQWLSERGILGESSRAKVALDLLNVYESHIARQEAERVLLSSSDAIWLVGKLKQRSGNAATIREALTGGGIKLASPALSDTPKTLWTWLGVDDWHDVIRLEWCDDKPGLRLSVGANQWYHLSAICLDFPKVLEELAGGIGQ